MPTAISTDVLRQRAVTSVLVDESTTGTLSAAPSGSNGATEQSFAFTEAPSWSQEVNTTQFSETGSDIITQDQATNRLDYATTTYSVMAKPNGTSEPAEGYLLKKFFGSTDTSGQYGYYFSNQVAAFSAWHLIDSEFLVAAAGGILNEMNVNISKEGNLIYTMSVLGTRLYYGGQATVASVSTNDITINAPDINLAPGANATNLFFANQPVEVFNNSGGASRGTTTVSSIAGNVVTVASAPASTDADDVMRATLSAGAVSALSPISMKNSAVYVADNATAQASLFASGNKVTVSSADMTLSRDIQTPGAADLTGSVYPAATYLIGNDFSINGSFTLNAQPNELAASSRFVDDDLISVGIQVDDGTNYIRFYMPQVRISAVIGGDLVATSTCEFQVVKGSATSDQNRFQLNYDNA
jgi:hypothetical protein